MKRNILGVSLPASGMVSQQVFSIAQGGKDGEISTLTLTRIGTGELKELVTRPEYRDRNIYSSHESLNEISRILGPP